MISELLTVVFLLMGALAILLFFVEWYDDGRGWVLLIGTIWAFTAMWVLL